MKTCKACGETKSLECFYVNKLMKEGYLHQCISCVTKARKAFEEETKAHGPRVVVAEKCCSMCKEVKVASEFGKSLAKSDGLNPECRACSSRKVQKSRAKRIQQDPMLEKARELCNGAKARAKKHDLPYELDPQFVLGLMTEKCPALGTPITYGSDKLISSSPTLDKFKPTVGYTKANTFFLSSLANFIKNSATEEQVTKVAEWLERVYAERFRA